MEKSAHDPLFSYKTAAGSSAMTEKRSYLSPFSNETAAGGSTTVQQNGKPKLRKGKIQRVPAVLREQKELGQYFEPKWISFGPIHYGKPKLKAAQKHKHELVSKFIRGHGYKSVEELYDEIKSGIAGLIRECFDVEAIDAHFDEETLKQILVFDGCAILQFIDSCSKNDDFKELEIKNDQVTFINHDLFLLENQIPYRVLKLLRTAKKVSEEQQSQLQDSLKKFIRKNVMAPPEEYHNESKVEPDFITLIFLIFSERLSFNLQNIAIREDGIYKLKKKINKHTRN